MSFSKITLQEFGLFLFITLLVSLIIFLINGDSLFYFGALGFSLSTLPFIVVNFIVSLFFWCYNENFNNKSIFDLVIHRFAFQVIGFVFLYFFQTLLNFDRSLLVLVLELIVFSVFNSIFILLKYH